jgi:hypothetical protein
MIGRKPYRIDVLTGIDGVTFSAAWKDRVSATLAHGGVFVIGKDALVANRTAAGRPKDLADRAMLAEAERAGRSTRGSRRKRKPPA